MKFNFINKVKNKIKSKNGNSFLFMPYLVTFGTMMMYISMEIGTAYVRQIELQTITDATARAGIYGGMTGSGAHFIAEKYEDSYRHEQTHVYVNLDDTVAQQVALAILNHNVNNMHAINTTSSNGFKLTDINKDASVGNVNDISKGQYLITSVNFCKNNNITKNEKIPVWSKETNTYQWVNINTFNSSSEIMSTGNFFVSINGEYKTINDTILGKNSLTLNGFASALATATVK